MSSIRRGAPPVDLAKKACSFFSWASLTFISLFISSSSYLHLRDNVRKSDVRIANIEAAKAVADAVRTSLGPRGMDKMVRGDGEMD